MTEEAGGRGVLIQAPRSLDELRSLRTDYEDLEVPELGGATVRVFALTGTARAMLIPDMAGLAQADDTKAPEVVRDVLLFQGRVVGASLGFPPEQWESVGDVLGTSAVDRIYSVAARLSGLDESSQKGAQDRLRRPRNAASGTD
jgi:hypothetical protein